MGHKNYIYVKAPEGFPQEKCCQGYCAEHHLVFWEHTGIVPGPNEVVHHKNLNPIDNRFENLELKSNSGHAREHALAQPVKMARLKCPGCGQAFEKPYRRTHLVNKNRATFCSRKCFHKFRGLRKSKPEEEIMRLLKDNVIDIYIKNGEQHLHNRQLAIYRSAIARRTTRNSRSGIWLNCQTCGGLFKAKQIKKRTTYCSSKCAHKSQQRVDWDNILDEQLIGLMWSKPASQLAKDLGVSDVAIAKHCKKRRIEKPPRGYWAMKIENQARIREELGVRV